MNGRGKSRRKQEIEPLSLHVPAAIANSAKTIATRSATLVEVWANVTVITATGELDVFYDIAPDGTTFVEELSSTGITTTGMKKIGVLSVEDKDAIGLAGRSRFEVKNDDVTFEIFALVRE